MQRHSTFAYEAGLAFRSKEPGRILIVGGADGPALPETSGHWIVQRPSDLTSATDSFAARVGEWLRSVVEVEQSTPKGEVERLLAAREWKAALVAAVSLLEWRLKDLDLGSRGRERPGLSQLVLGVARAADFYDSPLFEEMMRTLRLRNEALHLQRPITEEEARAAAQAVDEVLQQVSQLGNLKPDLSHARPRPQDLKKHVPESVRDLVVERSPSKRVDLNMQFLQRCASALPVRLAIPSARPVVDIYPAALGKGGRLASFNVSSGRLAVFHKPALVAHWPDAEVVELNGKPNHLRIYLHSQLHVDQALQMVQQLMQQRL